LRRGYASVGALITAINETIAAGTGAESIGQTDTNGPSEKLERQNPRWIRVNTIKTSLKDVLNNVYFKNFECGNSIEDLFSTPVRRLYYQNPVLLPNIFAIHPSHNITSNTLYTSGCLILQSAASCLPALMLDPPPGSSVIDACAAPGNKTTHLASVMKNKGHITATERDIRRADVLEMMVAKAGADKSVTCLKAVDFMTLDPNDAQWSEVDHLLLDPSCSGSGILGRVEWSLSSFSLPSSNVPLEVSNTGKHVRKRKRKFSTKEDKKDVDEEEKEMNPTVDTSAEETIPELQEEENKPEEETKDRLPSLTKFQLLILLHALAFSAAKRITYSTCSLHAEENEHVVVRALNSTVAKKRGWKVESRGDNKLKTWDGRGLPAECAQLEGVDDDERQRVAEGCVRVGRGDGLGGGFFVVCFVRDNGRDPTSRASESTQDVTQEKGKEEVDEEEWTGFDEDPQEVSSEKAAQSNGESNKKTMVEKPKKDKTIHPKKSLQKGNKSWRK